MSRATEMQGFLPDDYLEFRIQRRTNTLWALVFLVVACSIGWAYMIAQKKVQQAEEVNRRIKEEYAAQITSIDLFKKLQAEQNRLNTKAELVGSLGERVNRSNILAELTNRLPIGVYLTDLTLEGSRAGEASRPVERAVVAGQPKAIMFDVNLKLSGLAYTDEQVAEYMTNLEQCPLFAKGGVVFELTAETVYKEINLRMFQISVAIDPAADTRVITSVKAATKPVAK